LRTTPEEEDAEQSGRRGRSAAKETILMVDICFDRREQVQVEGASEFYDTKIDYYACQGVLYHFPPSMHVFRASPLPHSHHVELLIQF
jgi:hypothetical protein